jgi:hypothetical protein
VLQDGANFTSDAFFVAYDPGFTHKTQDATSPHRQAARVNPGVDRATDTAQVCPSMVGPFEGGVYFCTSREHGTCDRRSGTCFCQAGYQGIDCAQCQPSYFLMVNNLGGMSCYPKVLCPADCSGAGECDFWTGTCSCAPYRTGPDCATQICSSFHPKCEVCSSSSCLRCSPGLFINNSSTCASCLHFDPRCIDCTAEHGCTQCADSTLTSIRRSGFRAEDLLPLEESSREYATTLPFGSQSSEAFAQAETYRVQHLVPSLSAIARTCTQGPSNASWECVPYSISHEVCGHEGIFSFKY